MYAAAGAFLSTSETGSSEHSNANKPAAVPVAGSKTSLAILTATALTATFASAGSNATIALGLSYALVSAAGILLVQRAELLAQSSRSNGNGVIYSANGFLAQPEDAERSGSNSSSDVLRDVCAAAGLATLVASVTLESWHFADLVYHHEWAGRNVVGNWVARNAYVGFAATIAILLVHMLMYYLLLLMVSSRWSGYGASKSVGLAASPSALSSILARSHTDISPRRFPGRAPSSPVLYLYRLPSSRNSSFPSLSLVSGLPRWLLPQLSSLWTKRILSDRGR